jgi:large subunit ribosomal protein L25
MSKTIELNAEQRTDIGKGASRRLRRLQNKVPGIVYGGHQDPLNITLDANQLKKIMEHESFYTSVLHVHLDDKPKNTQTVLVKAIQRHPFKSQILHIDLQRVSVDDVILKKVPLHFVNAAESNAVKLGGLVSHIMGEVEVECKVKDLPEFIEVDLSHLELDQLLHLSELKLPKNVALTVDVKDELHNLTVASIHMPKEEEEEPVEAPVAEEVPTVAETEGEAEAKIA